MNVIDVTVYMIKKNAFLLSIFPDTTENLRPDFFIQERLSVFG